ncbi:MAG: adenylate/guanylate cyclase domain-containing protein, partial [Thermodesulfobacteriota bacterium]
ANDSLFIRELDYIKVKGKNEPILIFELISQYDDSKILMSFINKFQEALELYRKREFFLAKEKFERILEENEHDGPSELYIDRCNEYIQSPPPSDWDLVYTATSK